MTFSFEFSFLLPRNHSLFLVPLICQVLEAPFIHFPKSKGRPLGYTTHIPSSIDTESFSLDQQHALI